MSVGTIERLDQLLHSKHKGTEREIKLELSRLYAELKARREAGSPDSRDCFSATLQVLPRIKGSMHAILRMECLRQCVQYLYLNGYTGEALTAATQLITLSRRTQNRSWMQVAENDSGIVQADLGNVPDAVTHYFKSLELSKELGNSFAEVATLINIGVALNYAGLYREAIPCLVRAEALARTKPSTCVAVPMAAANLAQSYLYLEQYEEAYIAITRSLQESVNPSNADSALARTIREFTFVQVALELGKFAEALDHAKSCRRFAYVGRSDRCLLIADVTSALCEIYCGSPGDGIEELERALETSFENNTSYIDSLTLLVKAYDRSGRSAQALECMGKLLGYLRAIREKSVLALLSASSTHAAPAQVYSEDSDLRALQIKETTLRAQVAELRLFDCQTEMLERLAVTADLKEEISGQHGYRVGKLSMLFARELGWTRESSLVIEKAARLHDIGKIAVPDRILLSSGTLKGAQREFMFAHAGFGADLLSKSNNPQLRIAEEISRYHHEWWNGLGYPTKLSGKRIPLHARIVALADVFDALTHGRPYSEPWPIDAVLKDIGNRRGTQFDPELTDVFLAMIARLRSQHTDLNRYLAMGSEATQFAQARIKIQRMLFAELQEGRSLQAETETAQ
jgi:putative two-component system response regulator